MKNYFSNCEGKTRLQEQGCSMRKTQTSSLVEAASMKHKEDQRLQWCRKRLKGKIPELKVKMKSKLPRDRRKDCAPGTDPPSKGASTFCDIRNWTRYKMSPVSPTMTRSHQNSTYSAFNRSRSCRERTHSSHMNKTPTHVLPTIKLAHQKGTQLNYLCVM